MRKLQYNSPVILTFVILSAAALLMGELTHGETTRLLFSTYRSAWTDPLTYLRLFTHVLGHSGVTHFTGNMLMILVLGPMVEERYGSQHTFFLIAFTALATGIVHYFVAPAAALLGASGIVFMLIFLASLAGMRKNTIPMTLILVAVVYFGQEIYSGLFTPDNISHLTHIVGGCCGTVLGIMFRNH